MVVVKYVGYAIVGLVEYGHHTRLLAGDSIGVLRQHVLRCHRVVNVARYG